MDNGQWTMGRAVHFQSSIFNLQESIHFGARGREFAVDNGYDVHLGAAGKFAVGQAHDVVVEDVLEVVLLDASAHHKFVAAAQRYLVGQGDACHDEVDALLVQFVERTAQAQQHLVAGVFAVVLVVSVVDDTLQVALVVADLEF